MLFGRSGGWRCTTGNHRHQDQAEAKDGQGKLWGEVPLCWLCTMEGRAVPLSRGQVSAEYLSSVYPSLSCIRMRLQSKPGSSEQENSM